MTADARELGRIDLNISPSTGELESIDWKVIPVDSSIQEAPEFAAVYRKYAELLRSSINGLGARLWRSMHAARKIERKKQTPATSLATLSAKRWRKTSR